MTLPSAEEVIAAHPLLARRWSLTAPPSVVAVRAAIEEAKRCATSAKEEPAALFYAFATYRRAMPGAWRRLAALLAMNQARTVGCTLDVTADDLDGLASEILFGRMGWPEARAWFEARLG